MKAVKIISNLDIDEGGLITTSLKKNNEVFFRQGHADGACGPYCLFMALLIMGETNSDMVSNLWRVDHRTRFGKLIKAMNTNKFHTLFSAGSNLNDLKILIKDSYNSTVHTNINTEQNEKLINFVIEELKQNKPTIVGVAGAELDHWLLAIGYEVNENEDYTKILFLDPSGNENSNYWNAAINIIDRLKGKKYRYEWIDYAHDSNKAVKFEHAISFG